MSLTPQSSEKGKLVPVQVPWYVSLSTPFLTIRVAEFEDRTIEFVATFWSEPIGLDERKVKLTCDARLVNITSSFEFDRSISVENFDYDLSELEDVPSLDMNLKDWAERFNKKWHDTGFCPDPRMYEVIGSEWLKGAYNAEGLYKHYLVIGEMMAVEFLCQNWTWEAGETINWFKNG